MTHSCAVSHGCQAEQIPWETMSFDDDDDDDVY